MIYIYNLYIYISLSLSTLRIPDLVRNKYLSSHASQLKDLDSKVGGSKVISQALKGAGEATSVPTTHVARGNDTSSGGQDRTVASPDFGDDAVPNMEKRVDLESKTLDEFNASRTLLD